MHSKACEAHLQCVSISCSAGARTFNRGGWCQQGCLLSHALLVELPAQLLSEVELLSVLPAQLLSVLAAQLLVEAKTLWELPASSLPPTCLPDTKLGL